MKYKTTNNFMGWGFLLVAIILLMLGERGANVTLIILFSKLCFIHSDILKD